MLSSVNRPGQRERRSVQRHVGGHRPDDWAWVTPMTSQEYSVNEKVALITGAANGLGAAVARQMHAQGARLVLIDIDQPKLDELATELGKDRVFAQVADVRDFTAMKAAADKGIELFGGIDIVVANAAIGSFGTLSPSR